MHGPRAMHVRLVSTVILGAMLAWPTAVRASDEERREPDRPASETETRERRSILVGNALPLVLGRLSLDFGTFVAPHVVPTASVHGQATVMFGDERLFGLGGELGMRLYGGAFRPTGPFVGMYAVGGRYEDERGSRQVSIISYGGAADLGCLGKGPRPRALVQIGAFF